MTWKLGNPRRHDACAPRRALGSRPGTGVAPHRKVGCNRCSDGLPSIFLTPILEMSRVAMRVCARPLVAISRYASLGRVMPALSSLRASFATSADNDSAEQEQRRRKVYRPDVALRLVRSLATAKFDEVSFGARSCSAIARHVHCTTFTFVDRHQFLADC